MSVLLAIWVVLSVGVLWLKANKERLTAKKKKKKGRRYNIVVFWDVGFVYS